MTTDLKDIEAEIEAISGAAAQLLTKLHLLKKRFVQLSEGLPASIWGLGLKPGEMFAGTIFGDAHNRTYHLILLPETIMQVGWADATRWAERCAATLPNKKDMLLLSLNLSSEFRNVRYWTCDEESCDNPSFDGSDYKYAWFHHFLHSSQNYDYKTELYSARAVRRVFI